MIFERIFVENSFLNNLVDFEKELQEEIEVSYLKIPGEFFI